MSGSEYNPDLDLDVEIFLKWTLRPGTYLQALVLDQRKMHLLNSK